jgi:hypothetical protein
MEAHRQDSIDEVAERFESLDKSLVLVIQANGNLGAAQLMLRRQVFAARRKGHSWAAIGYALGVSKQAAQQRFGGTAEDEA